LRRGPLVGDLAPAGLFDPRDTDRIRSPGSTTSTPGVASRQDGPGGRHRGGVGAYLDAQEEKLARIPGTTVERADEDTLLVRFDSDLLFPLDSDRPTAQSMTTLAEVGDTLVRYQKTAVVVQGHTDSTGPEEYNQDLSERRALAVKDLLVDRGVDDRRVAAIGHGELYPVASNGFEDGRRRNRRVTILLKARGV
jgi:outer membrane protein OmpA-like peptidoglycan-associated protein